MKEAQVTAQIRGVLNACRVWHWKNWSGPMTYPKGIADILGCYKGKMIAIEIKASDWKPPGPYSKQWKHYQAQCEFIRNVNDAGGIAFFAQSAEEVVEKLGLHCVMFPLFSKVR